MARIKNSVWPKKEWFEEQERNLKGHPMTGVKRRAAAKFGVPLSTWTKWSSGKHKVYKANLRKFAMKNHIPLKELTCRPDQCKIIHLASENPFDKFIGKTTNKASITWHSVYLDYNRHKDEPGRPRWWRETITFTKSSRRPAMTDTYEFSISLKNAHGVKFSGYAYLLSEWQMTCLLVKDERKNKLGDDESIVLTFSERFILTRTNSDETEQKAVEVFVGSWPGTDDGNANMRIYRNLLSSEPLTDREIQIVADQRSLEVVPWKNCHAVDD